MARWAPDARGRLEQAASELFGERGYDATTVTEIAERAGLTERTFFRHFADKREVLFSGAVLLQEVLVGGVDDAPPSAAPLAAIEGSLLAAADTFFEEHRSHSGGRQAIIDAHPDLQERELIKMARLGAALADALRRRGVGDPAAGLAAEAGISVFRIAFEEWVHREGGPSLADTISAAFGQLRQVTEGGAPATT